ncbi:MAG: TRAP transporter substrate-binding protein DctP, partial [Deltaproteobacteria bacterium]|nr:TRAP transporter substrate-binding protein DctP [Deltaproteobacteria bacterium]
MKRLILGLCVHVLVIGAAPAFSEVIKLGTVAPEGSPWHEILLEAAQRWKELSNGTVTLRIYAGGVAGDEKDMLRKIRIGQLHAATLTSNTLIDIIPEIEVVQLPMLVRTDDELDYVMQALIPEFEARLAKRGFRVLTWSTAGWMHFFTKEPVVIFWGSDTTYMELLKSWGFNPVPLAVPDLLPSLQTGLVDSFPAPPAVALSFQWYSLAPNMMELRWQPLPGATVVSLRQWNKIPEELRHSLEAVARELGARLQKQIRQLEQEAIAAMQSHGLEVIAVSPAAEEQWISLAQEQAYPVLVRSPLSKEVFQTVL